MPPSGLPKLSSVGSSYNPDTAAYAKVQYDVRDVIEEALARLDMAILDAGLFPDMAFNLHRNHVRQIMAAAMDASLSHGMDIFCEVLMSRLEQSARETAQEGSGTLDGGGAAVPS